MVVFWGRNTRTFSLAFIYFIVMKYLCLILKKKKKTLNVCLETVCENNFLFLRVGNNFPTYLA